MLKYKVITPNAAAVIDLATAKLHLKVDTNADDALITSIIAAVRQHTQEYLGRFLLATTVDQFYNSFGNGCLTLFYTPVASITSVIYQDVDGENQTLAAEKYELDTTVEPSYFRMKSGQEAPAVLDHPNSVAIRYVTGYANAAAVPDPIKLAMLLMITRFYEHRDDAVFKMPTAAQNLLNPYRIQWLW